MLLMMINQLFNMTRQSNQLNRLS